jgi:hypothetical protein
MVSHLEVPEGEEVYVCRVKKRNYESLNEGAFVRVEPITPFVKGTYDDYGRVRVTDTEEAQRLFNACGGAIDDDGRVDDENMVEGRSMFIVRADAFDMLRKVRREFVWKGLATPGDVERQNYEALLTFLRKVKEPVPEPESTGDPALDAKLNAALARGRRAEANMELRDILGYGAGPAIDAIMAATGVNSFSIEKVPEVADFAPELIAEKVAQIILLRCGMTELRMEVTPQTSVGPQWNGWEAIEDYANWLLERVAARKKEYADEFEDAEDIDP